MMLMLMLVETQISTELTFDFPADYRQHSTAQIILHFLLLLLAFDLDHFTSSSVLSSVMTAKEILRKREGEKRYH